MGFKALKVNKKSNGTSAQVVELEKSDLTDDEVMIQVRYSSLNFKDALAVTGQGKILRKFPLIAGIDAAGVVEGSKNPSFKKGDHVVVTGCGLGESHDGGFSRYICVPASWVISLPNSLTVKQAMIFGTAGFTAGLAIERLLQNNQAPNQGPILVTGASGGVGSFSVYFLSRLGFEVQAVSGKDDMKDYLKTLGANEISQPKDLSLGRRALETSRWGGVIDNVGGGLLSQLIPHVHLWGNIASIGLAGGHELTTTVMPFILRGVSLLGISSTNCPRKLRENVWKKLGSSLKPENFDTFLRKEITLKDLEQQSNLMLSRQTWGRTIVQV